MKKMNKFVYNIILAILLVCTVIILYQVITNPLKRENHCLNLLNQAKTMVFYIFIAEAYHLYIIFWLWHVKPFLLPYLLCYTLFFAQFKYNSWHQCPKCQKYRACY